jgi:hypothetical protein
MFYVLYWQATGTGIYLFLTHTGTRRSCMCKIKPPADTIIFLALVDGFSFAFQHGTVVAVVFAICMKSHELAAFVVDLRPVSWKSLLCFVLLLNALGRWCLLFLYCNALFIVVRQRPTVISAWIKASSAFLVTPLLLRVGDIYRAQAARLWLVVSLPISTARARPARAQSCAPVVVQK